MAVKLNKAGFDHAERLIKNGLEVEHEQNTSNWDEVEPTLDEAVRFLNAHDLEEYGSWFLGVDTDADTNDRSKYIYPWGDFSVLHKSALLVVEEQAGENGDTEIKEAARKLIGMIRPNKA